MDSIWWIVKTDYKDGRAKLTEHFMSETVVKQMMNNAMKGVNVLQIVAFKQAFRLRQETQTVFTDLS